MLVISQRHMEAFENPAAPQYATRTVDRLKTAFPKHAAILGDAGLLELVSHGIKRAAGYGLKQQGQTDLFIDLMLLFGRSFHRDPQLPWAAAILGDESIHDPRIRAERLFAASTTCLERTAGPNGEFIQAAIRRLQGETLFSAATLGNFEEFALSRLRFIWPQKLEYIGEPLARKFIGYSAVFAQHYGITDPRGHLLILGLMFMLGTGFDSDPLVAWAGNTLRDNKFVDQAARLAALYRQALAYMKLW